MPELAGDQPAGENPAGVTNDAPENDTPDVDIENPDFEEPDNQDDDDSEEIDWEDGKKYRIPKAVKSGFMFHADYTKKTQEVAKRDDGLTERETALQQQTRIIQEHTAEIGEVFSLKKAAEPYEKFDWDQAYALAEGDPVRTGEVNAAWNRYQRVKDSLGQRAGALQQKMQQRALDDQRNSAKAVEEGHAAVAKDIKEWSPQHFDKLTTFVTQELGFKPDEVKGISDPRTLKALHRMYVGDQAIKKLAALEKAAAAKNAQPLHDVGAKKGTANQRRTTDASGDALSTPEWMKRENERLLRMRAKA